MISVSKGPRWLQLLPLVILGFLIYSNTLEVPFYFDDLVNIRENPDIRLTELNLKDITIVGLKRYSSRPVAHISFALNYYFHQADVTGYHVVNIIIHILTGIFLYFFIKTTLSFPSLRSRYKPCASIAFFAALLWLVHPVQTQSVTYTVQRMNSLAAMFYVLSFLLYVKGRLVKEDQKSWPWFAGCILAGILAIGSKEIAATLPFLILLYEWYFLQDLSTDWLKRHLPHVVGALIIFGSLAFLYLGASPLQAILSGYKYKHFTLIERVLTEFRVVIHYISLLAYPHPSRLNLDYDFPLSHTLTAPITTLFSIGAIVGLITWAIYLAKKDRLISFCILWFFGNLAIESTVIALGIIYEHRMYLPSMFFFLLIIVLAYRFVKQQWAIIGILSVGVILFSVWTYERNSVWGDPVTLWKDCVRKSPNKARPHSNLALALYQQGKFDEAIAHSSEALRISPYYPEAHNNLGVGMAAKGRHDEAISHYSQALRIKPAYAEAHYNWGVALNQQGKTDEAIHHYSKALRINPRHPGAHYNLGTVLARQGKLDEAIAHFQEALRIKPDHTRARYNLGLALQKQDRLDEAITRFSEALRIKPDHAEAHNNLGVCLASKGRLDEAIRHYSEALQIKPDYARAYNNLGLALLRQGRLDEAITHFSQALRIKPDYAAARYNLGLALRQAAKRSNRSNTFEEP